MLRPFHERLILKMALTSASSEKTMASGSGDGRSSRSESFIRGYHVYYQQIWNELGEVAEVAVAVLEDDNRYAVTKFMILELAALLLSRSSDL